MSTAKPQAGENWGILGGTFDPVHNGHITLAREICEKKNLTGILVIPAFHPPHKPGRCEAAYEDRINMLKLALEGMSFMTLCEIEKDENLSGYTLDTVRKLKNEYPDVHLYFIIGADNLEDIWNWHEPEAILKEIKIIAGTRPNFEIKPDGRFPEGRVEFVETTPVDIASRDIRSALKKGMSLDDFEMKLPEKVKEYITQRNLYRD